jgi:serine protease Do
MRIDPIRSWIIGGLVLAIAGCGQRGPQVVDKPIIPVAEPATARPVQFHRIVIDIKRGTDIGLIGKGISYCTERDRWHYRPGDLSFSGKELTERFRAELTAAHYNVVGDPDALFDDPSAWKAEYLVAGAIKSMNVHLCYAYDRWQDETRVNGYAVMDVNWQIYSRLDRKVVYQTTTQGRGNITQASVTGDPDVFLDGFAQATRNLLGDRGFHDLITGETPVRTAGPAIALQEAVVPNGAPFKGAIQQNMQAVRANVVTVRSVEGHGSGFFIDDAGHVLTNEHVVNGTNHVKVILESGEQFDGTVIAADPRRDVALVKVAPARLHGLPLKAERPEIGAEVYAVGSPLSEELSGTVSKGIVSAYRSFDGLEYIQSDVTTVEGSSGGPLLDVRGNVVGITVSGFTEADAPAGVNLFIPIGDALRALGVSRMAGTS